MLDLELATGLSLYSFEPSTPKGEDETLIGFAEFENISIYSFHEDDVQEALTPDAPTAQQDEVVGSSRSSSPPISIEVKQTKEEIAVVDLKTEDGSSDADTDIVAPTPETSSSSEGEANSGAVVADASQICEPTPKHENKKRRHKDRIRRSEREYFCDSCMEYVSSRMNIRRHNARVHRPPRNSTCGLGRNAKIVYEGLAEEPYYSGPPIIPKGLTWQILPSNELVIYPNPKMSISATFSKKRKEKTCELKIKSGNRPYKKPRLYLLSNRKHRSKKQGENSASSPLLHRLYLNHEDHRQQDSKTLHLCTSCLPEYNTFFSLESLNVHAKSVHNTKTT